MGMSANADLTEAKDGLATLDRLIEARERDLVLLRELRCRHTGRPGRGGSPADIMRALLDGVPLVAAEPNGCATHAEPLAADDGWLCWYKYELAIVYLATRPPARGYVIDAAVDAKHAASNARCKGFLAPNAAGEFELTAEGVLKLEQIKQRRRG
jgi:hypothetical protein